MKARVVTGSKQEIAETVARIDGDVREAIVFIQEPSDSAGPGAANGTGGDVFAEMEPFTVRRGDADGSRDSIYRRMEGE